MAPAEESIVVVAASAGGLQPLRELLSGLPPDFPAAVLVVLHIPASGGRGLPDILDRAGPLPAVTAVDGEQLQAGHVYVAPPDQHVLVVKGLVRVSRGPRQNGVRPAADPLFRSAALDAGRRVTAVVLSGMLDDGALGCATVESLGGQVIVQDPADAEYHSMPKSAIAVTRQPVVVPARDLAGTVTQAVVAQSGLPPEGTTAPDGELVSEVAGMLAGAPETVTASRTYSDLTCPECGGPLYHKEAGQADRAETYDCLVGHRYSPQSLLEDQSATVERALWLAIRSLEERGRLTGRLADSARARGHALSARQFAATAAEARRSADAIRWVSGQMTAGAAPEPDDA